MNDDADVKGGPDSVPKSSSKALDDGYNQTYVIMKNQYVDAKKSDEDHAVFFRCGNWCYMGQIQFNGLTIGTSDLSLLIPTLQKQQGSLRYYCNSSNVPSSSDYSEPLKFLRKATEFVANEMTSLAIEKELRKMSAVFPWIDADGASTYFELTMNDIPKHMENVGLVASKTYTRGLIIISIYAEKTFYFVIQSGEGDQALLDVNFPDVSKHGQGLLLQTYNDQSNSWRKLTLWHILDVSCSIANPRVMPKIRTVNVSTANYQQTYCVMKSTFDDTSPALSVHHDVLFRFGSWCYSGRVQLSPTLTLSDIPFVIPALRMQQGRLDYYCDVSNIPTNSPFARSLDYIQKLEPLIENQIFNSEEILRGDSPIFFKNIPLIVASFLSMTLSRSVSLSLSLSISLLFSIFLFLSIFLSLPLFLFIIILTYLHMTSISYLKYVFFSALCYSLCYLSAALLFFSFHDIT